MLFGICLHMLRTRTWSCTVSDFMVIVEPCYLSVSSKQNQVMKNKNFHEGVQSNNKVFDGFSRVKSAISQEQLNKNFN